jgi:hypothetical protein
MPTAANAVISLCDADGVISTVQLCPAANLSTASCASANENPYRLSTRATSTGCVMFAAVKISLTTPEPEESRNLSLASSCRASASLNDNFIDIGFIHELAPDCVKSGSTQNAPSGTIHVRSVYVQNPFNPRNGPQNRHRANRGGDLDDHLSAIRIDDLDRKLSRIPHIS